VGVKRAARNANRVQIECKPTWVKGSSNPCFYRVSSVCKALQMQIERKSTELSRRSKEESGGEEVYMMCILWAFLWMSVECQTNVR